MDLLEAHTRFATRPDQGMTLLPQGCDKELAPLLCVSVAAVGGLAGAIGDADLDDAFNQGMTRLRMGEADEGDLAWWRQQTLLQLTQWVDKLAQAARDN